MGESNNTDGRVLTDRALVSDQAPAGLAPSGFDPSRVEHAAKIIDRDAWHETLPTDGCGVYWMGRRNVAREKAAKVIAAMSEWRPFACAPADGSVILAYRPDAGVFTAHYVEEDAHLSSVLRPPEGDCYWFTTGGDDLTNDLPTYWMALPIPPRDSEGGPERLDGEAATARAEGIASTEVDHAR